MEALEHDCKLIRTNCAQYNEKGSEIIKMAGRVVRRLLAEIRSRVSSSRSVSAASPAAAAAGAGSGSAWGGGGGSSGANSGGAGSGGGGGDYVEAEDAMDIVSHGGYLIGNGGGGGTGGGGGSGGGGSGGGRTSGGGSSSAGFGGAGSGGRESGRTNKPVSGMWISVFRVCVMCLCDVSSVCSEGHHDPTLRLRSEMGVPGFPNGQHFGFCRGCFGAFLFFYCDSRRSAAGGGRENIRNLNLHITKKVRAHVCVCLLIFHVSTGENSLMVPRGVRFFYSQNQSTLMCWVPEYGCRCRVTCSALLVPTHKDPLRNG